MTITQNVSAPEFYPRVNDNPVGDQDLLKNTQAAELLAKRGVIEVWRERICIRSSRLRISKN
jgi:hypothetical protein